MGNRECYVENFVRGATFGLSDFFGITGRDGLIHDGDDDLENQAVAVDDKGLLFIEKSLSIGWDDVVEIVDASDGKGGILFCFKLRGGLNVWTGWIVGDVVKYLNSPACVCVPLLQLYDARDSSENIRTVDQSIEDLFWAKEISALLRGCHHLEIDEYHLLYNYVYGWNAAWTIVLSNNRKLPKCILQNVHVSDWQDLIANQLALTREGLDTKDPDVRSLLSTAFFWMSYGHLSRNPDDDMYGRGIARQKKVYGCLHTARTWEEEGNDRELQVSILASQNGDDHPIGDSAWVPYRRMIVCTDEPYMPSSITDGMSMPEVMVMDAMDVMAYNAEDSVSEELQLKFDQKGHPRNGVTYIQSQVSPNVYIPVEVYHESMLERKFEELIHLLTCLGATSIEALAGASSSRDKVCSDRRDADVELEVSGLGSASGNCAESSRSKRIMSLDKSLRKSRVLIPKGRPYIPNDLEFYENEKSWQKLAKLVLEGRILREEVALTYRNESAISESNLKRIAAKLKSDIPGYTFGVGANYEEEFESELKTLESLTWTYTVEFLPQQDSVDGIDRSKKIIRTKRKLIKNKNNKR